ncbi:tyrosine-type recombinase/integrase [Bacillus solitudinis]|uniref:tyrosine-type recombinase/integrase n=1 Tax=Bacillus solitudinis TaxID=2014074 RepID=UPI000C24E445|nr:site-specific integrase [Bacillus solitudinis]
MNEKALPSFADDFIQDLTEKDRQPSTIKRYTYDLLDFFEWLEINSGTRSFEAWKNLTPAMIEQFFTYLIKKRDYKVRTVRRIYSVLKQLALSHSHSVKTHAIFSYSPPDLKQTALQTSEWISYNEEKILISTISSLHGLSEKQQQVRPHFSGRNELIIRFFLSYGLSLKETAQLTMHDIRFEKNELIIENHDRSRRIVHLSKSDKQLAYGYYSTIPEPVRPRLYSSDPFFVAYDFQRGTFRWSYEADQPKALTEIAIQKMLRLEVARAGLRKGISAQHLRNTYILRNLIKKIDIDTLVQNLGFRNPLSLQRYFYTIKFMPKKNLNLLLPEDYM